MPKQASEVCFASEVFALAKVKLLAKLTVTLYFKFDITISEVLCRTQYLTRFLFVYAKRSPSQKPDSKKLVNAQSTSEAQKPFW